MSTLITVNDFINSGLPVSDDIRTEEIQFAIKTVEKTYLKNFIGAELYKQLIDSPTDYSNLLNETDYTNGIKHSEYEMVFAWLMYDRMRLTRYASVIKDDEHSTDPSEDDIMSICSMHWESALENIIETLLANDLEPADEVTPQPPFAELLFKYYNKHKR